MGFSTPTNKGKVTNVNQSYNLRRLKPFKLSEFNLPPIKEKLLANRGSKVLSRCYRTKVKEQIVSRILNKSHDITLPKEIPDTIDNNDSLNVSFIMDGSNLENEERIKAWKCSAEWLNKMHSLSLSIIRRNV